MEAGGSRNALDHRRNAAEQKKRQHTETMARYEQAKPWEEGGEPERTVAKEGSKIRVYRRHESGWI